MKRKQELAFKKKKEEELKRKTLEEERKAALEFLKREETEKKQEKIKSDVEEIKEKREEVKKRLKEELKEEEGEKETHQSFLPKPKPAPVLPTIKTAKTTEWYFNLNFSFIGNKWNFYYFLKWGRLHFLLLLFYQMSN